MGYFFILPAISAAFTLALGLLTWLRDPKHPSNCGFAVACATVSLAESGNFIMLWSGSPAGLVISVAGQALMPAAWLLFATVFGKPHTGALYRKAPLIAGLSATGLFFITRAFYGGFASIEPAAPGADGTFWVATETYGHYFYVFLILGLTLALIHLESALRLSNGSGRAKIKYLILGAGSLLAFHIYAASQALLMHALQAGVMAVISSATVISSGLMAWAVVREKLFKIDVFVSRHVLYNSFTVLLIGVYLLSVGAFTHWIQLFSPPFDFSGTLFAFTSLLVLAVLLTSSTLARKVELFISRNFYRHKYEFKDKWMEATAKISSRMSADEICSTLAGMVSSTTGSREVWIWLKDPRTGIFRLVTPCVKKPFADISPAHPVVRSLEAGKGPFFPKDLYDVRTRGLYGTEELKSFSRSLRAALITPLETSGEIIGFMAQGPDRSGAEFGADDFDFLKAVSTQAAVQIKNIRLNEDITAAKEAEVFNRMSSFIMHDLKNLTNSLSLVSRNARFNMSDPEFQADAIRTIDLTVSRMKGLIGRLTEAPGEPSLVRTGTDLNSVIDSAVKRVSMSNMKGASFVNDCGPLPSIEIDPDSVETVLYNLLTNAYEAVGLKGEIKISTTPAQGSVLITVSDNGPGIPKAYMEGSLFKPFRTTKKNGFGIGLCQCKAIIEAHGGSIEAHSAEGKGSSFRITLPLVQKSMVV